MWLPAQDEGAGRPDADVRRPRRDRRAGSDPRGTGGGWGGGRVGRARALTPLEELGHVLVAAQGRVAALRVQADEHVEQRLHAQGALVAPGPVEEQLLQLLEPHLGRHGARGPLPTRPPLAARSAGRQGAPSGPRRPRPRAAPGRRPVRVVARRPRPTSWARSRRRSVWGAGPRGSMGRSPPLGAAALSARRGPPRPRPSAPPAAAPSPPPWSERTRALRKPGRRPRPTQPRPGPSPAARSQPGRGQAGAANHGGAGRRRADLSAPPRPACRLQAPGGIGPRRSP